MISINNSTGNMIILINKRVSCWAST